MPPQGHIPPVPGHRDTLSGQCPQPGCPRPQGRFVTAGTKSRAGSAHGPAVPADPPSPPWPGPATAGTEMPTRLFEWSQSDWQRSPSMEFIVPSTRGSLFGEESSAQRLDRIAAPRAEIKPPVVALRERPAPPLCGPAPAAGKVCKKRDIFLVGDSQAVALWWH